MAHRCAIVLLFPSQFRPASQGPQCISKLSVPCPEPFLGHDSSLRLYIPALRTDPSKRPTWALEVGLGIWTRKVYRLGYLEYDLKVKAQPAVWRLLGLYTGKLVQECRAVQGFLPLVRASVSTSYTQNLLLEVT